MNMQKALRKLYKAISGEDNYKVNISKLLIDIHYALTGKTPVNKNNHARIISELADNWTGSGGGGGGGGSSDFSTAEVTLASDFLEYIHTFAIPVIVDGTLMTFSSPDLGTYTVPLYHGSTLLVNGEAYDVSVSGSATLDYDEITVTGDCTLTWTQPT